MAIPSRIPLCVSITWSRTTQAPKTVLCLLTLLTATVNCQEAWHYNDVMMGTIASQITSLTIVYSTVYSDADQRKHQSSRVTGLCAGNSPGTGTGEFPAQMASNVENVSFWWRLMKKRDWAVPVNRVCLPQGREHKLPVDLNIKLPCNLSPTPPSQSPFVNLSPCVAGNDIDSLHDAVTNICHWNCSVFRRFIRPTFYVLG